MVPGRENSGAGFRAPIHRAPRLGAGRRPAAFSPPDPPRQTPAPGRAGMPAPLALLRRPHREERRRKQTPARRIDSIQFSRGIADGMVVFHHWMQLGGGSVSGLGVGCPLACYGAFGVGLFFVVGGLVMRHAMVPGRERATSFGVHRIVRLVPAYRFSMPLAAAVAGLSGKFALTRWTRPASPSRCSSSRTRISPGCLLAVPARAFPGCGGLRGVLPLLWPAGVGTWIGDRRVTPVASPGRGGIPGSPGRTGSRSRRGRGRPGTRRSRGGASCAPS